MSEVVNPYAAPEQTSKFVGLSPDTEFLVSGECVLCNETVKLPPICVITGAESDLKSVTQTLHWTPTLLSRLAILFTGLGVPFFLSALGTFMYRGAIGNPSEQLFLIAVLCIVPIAVITIWVLIWRFRRSTQVTWFESRTAVQKQEARTRRRRVTNVVLITALGASVAIGTAMGIRSILALVWIVVPILLVVNRSQHKSGQPRFIGRHEGLHVILMSEAFCERVLALIRQTQ